MSERIQELLRKTSRTFAVSIPLLDEPLCHHISLSYLLFRIADTFEDGELWDATERRAGLGALARVIKGKAPPQSLVEMVRARPITDNPDYTELMLDIPFVLAECDRVGGESQRVMYRHLLRTAQGMADYLGKFDAAGRLSLEDIADLQRYCYIVAGIVGEMQTELFLEVETPLKAQRDELVRYSVFYGEGLQLTNIIKDSISDAKEQRYYLPARHSIDEVIALAERDFAESIAYLNLARATGASRNLIRYLLSPMVLAYATLDAIRVKGPGSKIGRDAVTHMLEQTRLLAAKPGLLTVGDLDGCLTG